jgi:hypothetical protein
VPKLDETWLGRIIDADFVRDIGSAAVDPAGENGEYHSFTFAGPYAGWVARGRASTRRRLRAARSGAQPRRLELRHPVPLAAVARGRPGPGCRPRHREGSHRGRRPMGKWPAANRNPERASAGHPTAGGVELTTATEADQVSGRRARSISSRRTSPTSRPFGVVTRQRRDSSEPSTRALQPHSILGRSVLVPLPTDSLWRRYMLSVNLFLTLAGGVRRPRIALHRAARLRSRLLLLSPT